MGGALGQYCPLCIFYFKSNFCFLEFIDLRVAPPLKMFGQVQDVGATPLEQGIVEQVVGII